MGVTVEIAVPDQQTRDRLAHQWSRAVVAAPDEPAEARTTARPGAGGAPRRPATTWLTTQVTMEALRATAGRRINLHAGGVADERRRVLAVVGPSGTGKTTATLALARRLGYVSDETVSIDPDGTVAPHPKPLSVVIDPQRLARQGAAVTGRPRAPADARRGTAGPSGRPAAGRRGPEGSGQARHRARACCSSSSSRRRWRSSLARSTPWWTLIEGCGGLWALTYEEIDDHVDELVELLADPPAQPQASSEPTLVLAPGPERRSRSTIAEGGPLLARRPWAEAVEIDDQLIVLTESRAVLLADLTATVWLHLARPCSVEELVRAAEQAHGAHPDAAAIVGEAVTTLVEESLVARGSLA